MSFGHLILVPSCRLGWSIGVPTVLFENVTAGRHTVTVEHVKPKSRASAASTGTSNFRLIAIATT